MTSTGTGEARLARLLDPDPQDWRGPLDRRYAVVEEVLAGKRPAVIYPAGRVGRAAAGRLRAAGASIVALGDGNASLRGSAVDGLPVLSPSEIAADHRDDVVLVATTLFDSAITADLRERGCEHVVPVGYVNLRLRDYFPFREYDGMFEAITAPANRAAITQAFSLLADEESRAVLEGKLAYHLEFDKQRLLDIKSERTIYFDDTVYALGSDEVVADGGAFVGDTLEAFLEICCGRYRGYFGFEPDPASYARLAAVAESDPSRITAVPAGLSDRTSSARLLSTQGVDSRVLASDEPGGEDIELVSLDEYFDGRDAPTLIKMDVEGAEAAALTGARGLLEHARPKLAISAYHYPTDVWTLPLLINELLPDSRIFLRHYTDEVDDTVCYAIPGTA